MDTGQKYIYTKVFENNLVKSMGNSFQQHFYDLMAAAHNDFVKVLNDGPKGDKKCDGYQSNSGTFYQAYGPRGYLLQESNEKYAANKLVDDFEELLKHVANGDWPEVKKYIFVFGTHRGQTPTMLKEIQKLRDDNSHIEFEIIDIDDLLRIFISLDDDNIPLVARTFISVPDFELVNYKILGDIMSYISSHPTNNSDKSLIPPKFDNKIEFNKINEFYATNLKFGTYSKYKVDDFFSAYLDTEIADKVCGIFKDLYEKSKLEYPDDSNLQFNYILQNCYSPDIPENEIQSYQTNAYVMMAKYFETCDIFVEPPNNDS